MTDKKPNPDDKKSKLENVTLGAKHWLKTAPWWKKSLLALAFTTAAGGAVYNEIEQGVQKDNVNTQHAALLQIERDQAAQKAKKASAASAKADTPLVHYAPVKSWPDHTTTRSSSPGDHLWKGTSIQPNVSTNPVEAVWRGEIAGVEVPRVKTPVKPSIQPIPTTIHKMPGTEKVVNVAPYEDFVRAVQSDQLTGTTLFGNVAIGKDRANNNAEVITNVYNPTLFLEVTKGHHVETPPMPPSGGTVISSGDGDSSGGSSLMSTLGGGIMWIGGIALSAVIFISIMNYMQRRQQGGAGAFGKSKARRIDPKDAKVRFSDVAGVESVKGRLMEMVDLLQSPDRPGSLGGKHPTGFLMSGPPGTGKTLLAKAVAGQAGVPFFSVSGSEFVEMYVGTGAARVRDLFKEARDLGKPCVIFIDEIDAVGGKREGGQSGGGKEHEQTLNQLLTELDGFEGRKGIIVIAATNRPEMLDPALKRSGRFNKEIVVPLPDMRARIEVAQLYFDKLTKCAGRNVFALDDDENKRISNQLALELAQGTPGMSPADLEALINEAALEGERKGHPFITWQDVSEARDTMWMGDANHNKVMSLEEKEATAYHEAGHAMVALLNPQCDPPEKLTVLPRGGALGMLVRVPTKDRVSLTYGQLIGDIEVAYAGREAEIKKYGINGTSTGAQQDLKQAKDLATRMVMDWGMTLNTDGNPDNWLGACHHSMDQGSIFARSEAASAEIDAQIKEIVVECNKSSRNKVVENWDKLELIVAALLKWETLKGSYMKRILEGENIDDIMANEKADLGIEFTDIIATNDNDSDVQMTAAPATTRTAVVQQFTL